tara:strand:+ start:1514 stop:1792 length:279 start_codon:yes stop_codon:yes gene_type:complete
MVLTDHKSLGEYADVSSLPFSERKMTYNRGFGNTVVLSLSKDGKIKSTAVPYNRLQPLNGNFGKHLPSTADKEFQILNPQTNLAWDNNPKYQ